MNVVDNIVLHNATCNLLLDCSSWSRNQKLMINPHSINYVHSPEISQGNGNALYLHAGNITTISLRHDNIYLTSYGYIKNHKSNLHTSYPYGNVFLLASHFCTVICLIISHRYRELYRNETFSNFPFHKETCMGINSFARKYEIIVQHYLWNKTQELLAIINCRKGKYFQLWLLVDSDLSLWYTLFTDIMQKGEKMTTQKNTI